MSAHWPNDRTQRLIELYAGGMSAANIAQELGVTCSSVEGRLARLREKGILNAAIIRRGPRRSKAHDRPCTAPYAPDSSTPAFAHDEEHVAACCRLGGFPVLVLRAA